MSLVPVSSLRHFLLLFLLFFIGVLEYSLSIHVYLREGRPYTDL